MRRLISLFILLIPCLSFANQNGKSPDPIHRRLNKIKQQTLTPEFPFREIHREEFERKSTAADTRFIISQHTNQQDHTQTSGLAAIGAPARLKSFAGPAFDNFDPPDPIIAAGPLQIVTAVNTVVSIYSKAGHKFFQTSMANWFAALPDAAVAHFFDCKVMYDQYDGHFIVLSLGIRAHAQQSFLFFSVSKTSDATGEWMFWELDMTLNNKRRTQLLADFPGLGLDSKAIYVTANMLNFSDGAFQYTKLRILKKNEVYGFKPLHFHDFWNLKDITGRKTMNLQPAESFGNTAREYLVSSDAVQGSRLTLWNVSNPVSPSPTLRKRAVVVSAYHTPPNALQKGGGVPINTGDAGVGNVVFRSGSLYTAQAIAHDFGSGTVSAIRYYQIRTNGVVNQEITYGTNGRYDYYPAVMVDSRRNVVIVFNRSSDLEFAGIFFTGRQASDPLNSLQNSVRFKPGFANYEADPDLNLWGDYNGIALDADDSVWIFSEYAKTASHWGTQIGHVTY